MRNEVSTKLRARAKHLDTVDKMSSLPMTVYPGVIEVLIEAADEIDRLHERLVCEEEARLRVEVDRLRKEVPYGVG